MRQLVSREKSRSKSNRQLGLRTVSSNSCSAVCLGQPANRYHKCDVNDQLGFWVEQPLGPFATVYSVLHFCKLLIILTYGATGRSDRFSEVSKAKMRASKMQKCTKGGKKTNVSFHQRDTTYIYSFLMIPAFG